MWAFAPFTEASTYAATIIAIRMVRYGVPVTLHHAEYVLTVGNHTHVLGQGACDNSKPASK